MKRFTTLLLAMATAGLLMGFGPQQEAPPAEKEAAPAEAAPAEAAPAEAEAPPAEAAPAEAAPAEAAPAEAEAAPAEAAPAEAAAPVTCKKYVECTCALAKASGDKAACKDAKTAYKGKAAEDCSADFQSKVQPQLDGMAADAVPAKCK